MRGGFAQAASFVALAHASGAVESLFHVSRLVVLHRLVAVVPPGAHQRPLSVVHLASR